MRNLSVLSTAIIGMAAFSCCAPGFMPNQQCATTYSPAPSCQSAGGFPQSVTETYTKTTYLAPPSNNCATPPITYQITPVQAPQCQQVSYQAPQVVYQSTACAPPFQFSQFQPGQFYQAPQYAPAQFCQAPAFPPFQNYQSQSPQFYRSEPAPSFQYQYYYDPCAQYQSGYARSPSSYSNQHQHSANPYANSAPAQAVPQQNSMTCNFGEESK